MLRLIVGLLVAICLSSQVCFATTWYNYTFEDGTAGNSLPNNCTNGPTCFEYDDVGVYRSDATVGLYGECQTVNLQAGYLITIQNGAGTYGTAFTEDSPISLVQGTTYYLGGMIRFERISGNNIWQDTAAEYADEESSVDKMYEIQGANTRWGISSGWLDTYASYCDNVGSPCQNHFTFQLWFGANSGLECEESYEHLNHDVSPYGDSNPYMCDYEKWYSVVMGITMYNSTSGRVRLWINGTLVTDKTGLYTMCSTAGSTIRRIYMHGTVAQPAYDAPAHKRQSTNLILTDSWSEIQSLGLDQDPEAESETPSSSAHGMTIGGGAHSVAVGGGNLTLTVGQ